MSSNCLKRAATLLVVLIVAAGSALASSGPTKLKTEGVAPLVAVGADPIPFALKNLKGETVKLEDFLTKKAVVMVFWSLFCGPCQEELPLVNAVGKKYADKGLEVLTINLDGEGRAKAVEKYMEKRGFSFKVLWENIQDVKYVTADSYGVNGTPTTIIIGKNGKVSHVVVGQEDQASLEKAVEAALQ